MYCCLITDSQGVLHFVRIRTMSSKLSCETGVGWNWFADSLKEASPNYTGDFERQNCSMTELAVNRWSELKLYYCNRIVTTLFNVIWKTQAYLLLPVCKTSKSVVVWIPLLRVHKNIISHKMILLNQHRSGERSFWVCICLLLHVPPIYFKPWPTWPVCVTLSGAA